MVKYDQISSIFIVFFENKLPSFCESISYTHLKYELSCSLYSLVSSWNFLIERLSFKSCET